MVVLPLFMLQVLWLVPPSSSNMLDPSVLQGNAPQCYNQTGIQIQYPFGGVGNGSIGLTPLAGFEIECNGSLPKLKLGSDRYPLLNLSLDDGYVRIVGQVLASRCPDNSSGHSLGPYHVPDLTDTPYTFSAARNKFTATGCDAMALIHGSGNKRVSSGCVSFCADLVTVTPGVCSGVGCCQAPVPPGLKSFQLEFSSVRNLSGSTNESAKLPCSKAFIVDKAWYNFTRDDLRGNPGDEYRPVFLDWAIGNQKCQEVIRRNDTDYACKDNSHCIDSPDVAGYRCSCDHGYIGNPYSSGGCKDIDECAHPDTNPCARKCTNTKGSYKCSCPRGTRGDGLKTGTGCERIAPLDIALAVGLVSLVVLFVVSFWVYWGLKKRRIRKLKQTYFFQNGGLLLHQRIASRQETAKIFSSEELETATDNFNENRVVGRGGYGTVYKGVLADGRVVAIKKSKLVDETQIEQFINEVVILSQINHRNVVKLLGCCLETQVPLLVYEFISNGTLFHHIHDKSTSSMSWENLLRIAVETAGALAYLHSAASIPIIHRDIKSANILLDENYTAKVSDFGASRTEEGRNLASHFVTLEENHRLLEAVDGQIVNEAGERHLFVVAQLAKRCLSLKGEERPTMKEVAVELDALRRLMKLHFVPKSHDELSPGTYPNPHNSGTMGQCSMEDSLLLSMEFPR
ncbi:wall-associated receptor kinase 17 isoform X2 [Elaeis guineensis]|uniref:Wall-associated receptor kinase 2 isoform X2 n=1 Tax=Elaeis guineensis var. tenera TaxID=51953 RepID=A0A8N4F3Z3_ELAGV|nr:wall-associated receptor kinase 2 isoform X2 [Elaeis guineensis]